MPVITEDEIRNAFHAVQSSIASNDRVTSDMVVQRAINICNEFHITASTLATHWESFSLNHSSFDADNLTSRGLDALRSHVKRQELSRLKREARSLTFRRQSDGNAALDKKSVKGMFSTPSPPKRSAPDSSSQTREIKSARTTGQISAGTVGKMKNFVKMASTYKERPMKSRGTYVGKPFNPAAMKPAPIQGGGNAHHRCKIALLGEDISSNDSRASMHMYTPPSRKAEILESELHVMSARIIEQHNLKGQSQEDDILEPVGMPTSTNTLVCGRICCHIESRDGVGTLNAESLLLEGSRSRSMSVRVRLDVSRVPNLDLFPGQIVVVRGTNPDGTTMIAEQIYSSAAAPRPTTSVADLLAMNHADSSRPADLDEDGSVAEVVPSLGSAPLEILVAAGPFCVVDDLEYEPLDDFVKEVIKRKPDVVLLIGPFVDTTNQKIKLGDIQLDGGETGPMPVNYMDLFRHRVIAAIEGIVLECPGCQILLVPHPDDAHHQATYPQPKFSMQELIPDFMYEEDERAQFMKSVKLLPNPCVVSINEMKVGINAADILRHMLPEDVYRVSAAAGSKKPVRAPFSARLPAHIWQQNSFYPLFPAGKELALDLSRADRLTSTLRSITPDVMILASKLNHFANECKGVLCINPGRLTKGVAAGTYARIVLQPFSAEALHQQQGNLDAKLEHDCLKRASVSILRI